MVAVIHSATSTVMPSCSFLTRIGLLISGDLPVKITNERASSRLLVKINRFRFTFGYHGGEEDMRQMGRLLKSINSLNSPTG